MVTVVGNAVVGARVCTAVVTGHEQIGHPLASVEVQCAEQDASKFGH